MWFMLRFWGFYDNLGYGGFNLVCLKIEKDYVFKWVVGYLGWFQFVAFKFVIIKRKLLIFYDLHKYFRCMG